MIALLVSVALGSIAVTPQMCRNRDDFMRLKLPGLCAVISQNEGSALAAAFARQWGLDADQSACAVTAVKAMERAGGRGDATTPNAWRACVERWPNVLVLWSAANLEPSGLAFAEPFLSKTTPETRAHLMKLAGGSVQPALAKLAPDVASRIEILRRASTFASRDIALHLFEDSRAQLTLEQWEALVFLINEALLDGEPLWAAELFAAFPKPIRERLARDPSFLGSERPWLALGLLALGDSPGAKSMVFEPLKPDAPLGRRALEWSLTGARTKTAWDESIAALEDTGAYFGVGTAVVLRGYLVPHEGRLDVAVANRASEANPRGGGPWVASRLAAARARAMSRWVPAKATPPKATAAIDTPATFFTERTTKWSGETAKRIAPLKVPAGFVFVRAEKLGTRTVVLATSERFDPMYFKTSGGYWLLVLEGSRWTQTYLGLAEHGPFVASRSTTVPLLDAAGMVRVVVDEAPRSAENPRAEPTVLRTNVVLEAPLKTLQLDSDGDGLSDVAEARLLLDAHDADSDHDGVLDGNDRAPRTHDTRADATTAMWNAFFVDFAPLPDTFAARPWGDEDEELWKVADALCVEFYVFSEPLPPGVTMPARFVALTPAEYAAASRRFGPFLVTRLGLTSESANHGLIGWSRGRAHGSRRIDLAGDGGYVVTKLHETK